MPRQLKEIKEFSSGIVSNQDAKDLPDSTATFSLNIDPMSKLGELDSIKSEKLIGALSNSIVTFDNSIQWGTDTGTDESLQSTDGYNNSQIVFNNLEAFDNQSEAYIKAIGKEGTLETLHVNEIEPVWAKLMASSSINAKFKPSTAFGQDSDYVTYSENTNDFGATATVTVPDGDGTMLPIGLEKFNIKLISTDGTEKTYVLVDDNASTVATGDVLTTSSDMGAGALGTAEEDAHLVGGIAVSINLSGGSIATQNTFLVQLKAAIEHANGHNGKITVSAVPGSADGAQSITLTQATGGSAGNTEVGAEGFSLEVGGATFTDFSGGFTLDMNLFAEGDYLSFISTGGTFTGRAGYEIFQITSIDADNSRLYFKRRCFGSPTTVLAAGTTYDIYANKITVNGVQSVLNKGTCKIQTNSWSDHEGNNIGGGATHLYVTDNATKMATHAGKIDAGTNNVTFNSTNKTFIATGLTTNLKKNDVVTFYASSNDKNINGYRAKVTSSGSTLTFDNGTSADDSAFTSGTVYYETNLLKNHMFHHQVDEVNPTVEVGATENYTVNDWRELSYNYTKVSDTSTYIVNNYYSDLDPRGGAAGGRDNTQSNVTRQWKSVWDAQTGEPHGTDITAELYPFSSSHVHMKLIAEFQRMANTISLSASLTPSDTEIPYVGNVAKNDILSINGALNENVRVLSVNSNSITVQRGVNGTTAGAIANGNTLFKCVNTLIRQDVSKDYLKSGQMYQLSFWAKNVTNEGYGALSLQLNGGNFNSNGTWDRARTDSTQGYNNDEVMQEHRWIDFTDLDRPNNDSSLTNNGLDSTFRKFSINFMIPKNMDLTTDLTVEFSSRGKDTSAIGISATDLKELPVGIIIPRKIPVVESVGIIDNKGSKDVVAYDSTNEKFNVFNGFNSSDADLDISTEDILKSPFVSDVLNSSQNTISMVSKNREVHVGMGGNSSDSPPQWIGYLNRKVFGQDMTDTLYRDEDTVHSYDINEINTISKLCVAGEHEYLEATWSSPNLTIDHTAHSMNVGDNIIVREYGDDGNNWPGAGVWVVTTANTNDFICKRDTDFDKQLTSNSFTTTDSADDTGRICYRPYFYYGVRDGSDSVYRIWPDTRIKSDLSADTDYPPGKIEKSSPLQFPLASIATCYNKSTGTATNGDGGGCIYVLSKVTGDVSVVDVQVKWDNWEKGALTVKSTLTPEYKSFKWSNDNKNGNINGDTEVFGGLASESTPTIQPAGIVSDIIETKGPTHEFVHITSDADNNPPDHYDTRLWIQFYPPGEEEGFTEGDRFLFCGLTVKDDMSNNSTIYMGDRTPTTNIVLGNKVRYQSGGSKFSAGPGIKSSGSHIDDDDLHPGIENTAQMVKHAYFYHYYDEGNNRAKDKMETYALIEEINGDEVVNGGQVGSHGNDNHHYINFGYNVGWNGNGGVLPRIRVPKYGLFPISDNDRDGVLDGTGVVTPSTTSITHTGSTDNIKRGPYGNLHQRVTGHAVGFLGSCDLPWERHWGRLHNKGHNYASGKEWKGTHYLGFHYHEDAPESMDSEKLMFICSDVHFGDTTVKTATITANASYGLDTGSGTEFTTGTTAHGFQPGDIVYVDKNGYRTSETVLYVRDYNTFVIRTAYEDTSTDEYTVYPMRIKSDSDGIRNDLNLFHYAYNNEEPEDGEIFTKGHGSGHYTRTWYTTPASLGMFKNTTGQGQNMIPGHLVKIEKLNYRAGFMIRPFDTSEKTFEDLVINNGTAVDLPSWPNPVYHNTNSDGNLYHHVNNDEEDNYFASKLFISSPYYSSSEDKYESYIYQCDLNFMYPDKGSQIEQFTDPGEIGTNEFNDTQSWDVTMEGIITSYNHTTGAYPAQNAAQHPLVVITDSEVTYHSDMLDASSPFKDNNRFAGQCLSIISQDTGLMQTRYIVGSHGDATTTTLNIHYPFGHEPSNDDHFIIWKHSLVCTAPVRLMKTTILENPHNLPTMLSKDPTLLGAMYSNTGSISDLDGTGTLATATTSDFHNLSTNDLVEIEGTASYNGTYAITVTSPKKFTFAHTASTTNETGNWNLLNESDSSSANPLKLDISAPMIRMNFGDLDMRKAKTYATRTADPSIDGDSAVAGSDAEARIFLSEDPLLITGDSITVQTSGTDAFDGTYTIYQYAGSPGNSVDVYNPQTGDDNTDSIPITTNQWGGLVMASSGLAKIGELRSGFASWDKGNIVNNVVRYDKATASDDDIYMSLAESSVLITASSAPNGGSTDYFKKNKSYDYKVSLIYDGYQEGPLSNSMWTWNHSSNTYSKLNIKLKINNYSNRISHVCLYRRDDVNDFFKLVSEVKCDSGWANDGTNHIKNIQDKGPVGATYASRSGYSEVLDTISLKYGISTEIDGFLFAGRCYHESVKKASNMVFRSKPGMYSIFDFSSDFLELKSQPTALANFSGKLFAFDKSNIYKINPQYLAIEDTLEGIGCISQSSLVVTDYGMFFADKNGAYFHDGQSPRKISNPIQKGMTTESFGNLNNIKDVSWESVVGNANSAPPKVSFDSKTNSALFFVEYIDAKSFDTNSLDNRTTSTNYIWAYQISQQRWDLWELDKNSKLGTPFIGDDNKVFIPLNGGVYELHGGSSKKPYTWLSKKINMNEDSIFKVFNKVKINGINTDLTSGDDKLIVRTTTGTIGTSDITYKSVSSEDADYKLSGSNKKGRWVQFKLEDMTEPLSSVGIIYRRKSTK